MTKKKSKQNPIVSSIIAVVVVIVGAIFYAVTGIDLTDGSATPEASSTQVASVATPAATGDYEVLTFEQGSGARSGFWQVYFTSPINTRDRSQYQNGVDTAIAEAIDVVQNTLDIAAFEMNNEVITDAILRAHERGVAVRIVTDNEHGIEDDDTTLLDLELEGIDIIDDGRSALMHNKFMIMDGITVWMGSMNYTTNGVYRNNNNMLVMRSRRAVETYQAEFDEMFERGEFGTRSDDSNTANFTQDGTPIEIYFASENEVVEEILQEINGAQSTIRFMIFSFTRDDMGEAMMAQAAAGIDVQGVFETTGSKTRFSEMPRLLCAGVDVRQDGNNGALHHKVIIIDSQVVITGSFNFSNNAVESNDENVVIIRNADIASLYLQEFQRIQNLAAVADDITCD
ncbi:MAG: phospholipase D-like domain-containing protein [Anaerolineae bacterium]|nr:phospholipase D-like domain-containing protein [Anaerolineae bacterium]